MKKPSLQMLIDQMSHDDWIRALDHILDIIDDMVAGRMIDRTSAIFKECDRMLTYVWARIQEGKGNVLIRVHYSNTHNQLMHGGLGDGII